MKRDEENEKVVGIIGGMGPLATVDLMNKIILYTPAKKDRDKSSYYRGQLFSNT